MPRYSVRRLEGNPMIRPHHAPGVGGNVQGPSLVRVPDWVPDRLGRYYLYFADHKGDHIRLAFADALEGPWRIHPPGALRLEDSGFATRPPAREAGVVPPLAQGTRPGLAAPGTPGIPDAHEDATIPHIASPDVHVDDDARRFVMYFHGLESYGRQLTRVAVSADGLRFRAVSGPLGPSYFRAFRHGGHVYALAMPGILYRSADGMSGFERGPDLFGDPLQRHAALRRRGDTLDVFWTRVGDVPERILVSTVPLRGPWTGWSAGPPSEVLRPERDWEGADLPLAPSYRSAIAHPVNQLRDPAILEDDGRIWLAYAVGGEAGIAIAELAESADD